MNTRQKLTLGIAAIFMVTLTIVGVTYAYFVTRVTGDANTPVEVTSATLGDIKYVKGNDGLNGTDVLTMTDVIPGDGVKDVVYKKFAVRNFNEDDSTSGKYEVIITNKVMTGKNEFIHTAASNAEGDVRAAGQNAGTVLTTCYKYNPQATLDATVEEPLTSVEAIAADVTEDTTDAASVCFPQTGDSIYNNIKINLYAVNKSTYDAGNFTDAILTDEVGTQTTLKYKATETITDPVEIFGTEANMDYYVLRVEYENINYNQNAENLAGLEIIVSIQGA